MTYKNLMINMALGQNNDAVLRAARELSNAFDADVTGVAACQPLFLAYGDAYLSGDVVDSDREEIAKELQEAEAAFRAALAKPGRALEWRSTVSLISLAEFVAQEARCADLVIGGVSREESGLGGGRVVKIQDVVMLSGRPTLLAPAESHVINLTNAVIAWKETREARRAAFDALPILQKAARTTLVEIAPKDELAAAERRLKDVVRWLARHGVAAEPMATISDGEDAVRLDSIVQEQKAGLLIAGAYGHSRAREWMFGGMTRDVLMRPAAYCALLSH